MLCLRFLNPKFGLLYSTNLHLSVEKSHRGHNSSPAIYRLTALWAFSEAGLGGFLFALHIPFTGFLLGAVSIILLSLIAHFSSRPFLDIVQATTLVLMVKALAAPHSSPAAYIAVGFQGFLAAVLFSLVQWRWLACVLLGIISMAESAVQKLLVLTFIFGNSLWNATDSLVESIAKTLHVAVPQHGVLLLIAAYTSAFALWGFVVGWCAAGLPRQLSRKEKYITEAARNRILTGTLPQKLPTARRRVVLKWTPLFLLCVAILVLSFYHETGVLFLLLRSLAAIILLLFIVKPGLQYLLKRYTARQSSSRKKSAMDMLNMLPKLNRDAALSWQLSACKKNVFRRLRYFLLCCIVLSLTDQNIYAPENSDL